MSNYDGPERRTGERRATVTFTREDSDRLVRIEEAVKIVPNLLERMEKVERRLSWFAGIGAAVMFVLSAVIGFFHKEL